MVRYLVIKAKHKHALQEHECLIEELRAARAEQNYWYEKKEGLLDEFSSRQASKQICLHSGWSWLRYAPFS